MENLKIRGNVLIECLNKGITSVTIPEGVTDIGWSAFEGCTGLAAITIPDSVTLIGDRAFYGCTGLTSVTIGNSVTSIGDYAFYGCKNLTSVIWNAENCQAAGSHTYYIFKNCPQLTNVTIGDNVKVIPSRAFSGCTGLTSIVIPDSVTRIGCGSFYGCAGLTSITIPNSVTIIGASAFECCTRLTSVTIGNGVTSIGRCAFCCCNNLKSQVKNYKAFDLRNGKLSCLRTWFYPMKWSDQIDNIKICQQGYHYCTNLFDIFNYYSREIDKDIAIYECEVGDVTYSKEYGDSKHVTNKIKPIKRLYREDIIRILNGQD